MPNPVSSGLSYLYAVLTAGAALLGAGPVPCVAQTMRGAESAEAPFNRDLLLAEAKRLSMLPYAPGNGVPEGLARLTAEQYRDIHFAAEAAIWREDHLPFTLQLLPAGFYFQMPLRIALVENETARDLVAAPGMFLLGPAAPPQLANIAFPLSGFSVSTQWGGAALRPTPTSRPGAAIPRSTLPSRAGAAAEWEEFARFQGASYFRAHAKGQIYGLSARGLALNIAEPMGEEFPAFRRFWIERPAAGAADIVVHALLDSVSVTGAYTFNIRAGAETAMDVDVTLFPRTVLRSIGIAPLTSMFLYDESRRAGRDDYRPEVHDSDGLEITSQSGEFIWRPLANPAKLQVSAFTSEAPRGFGLVQRSRNQGDFEDMDAHYEKRPSAWVEPTSEWGDGAVELVEIPSARETNDNITAFWRPASTIMPGKPWHVSYRLSWLAQPKLPKGVGHIVSTRSGASSDGTRRLILIDYVGAGERTEGLRLDLSASAGKISNVSLTPNSAIHGMRVGFELDPNNTDVIELRLRVLRNNRPITETLAVSVDGQLNAAVELTVRQTGGGMPPLDPLAMPAQSLRYAPPPAQPRRVSLSVWFCRLVLFGVTIGITGYGVFQMLNAVRFASMTFLQGLMILFFAVTLNWIGFAAGASLAGLFKGREPKPPQDFSTAGVRTALVMPVYNEDPQHVTSALQAMAEALIEIDAQENFEIVILSDSTSADAWVRETVAVDRLRAQVTALPVWYRRRWQNTARKAGNVEDFVERWGGRFEYMIVLDADSLIEAATLVSMLRKMHADPAMGILQTSPSLIGATTLFGRMQQFAARMYGPIVSRGLAAWSGDNSNYWGHNAIIRVRAFAEYCGLPVLPGRKPFGGHVMSHDFVEAALIRRAGWKVRLATDLGGTFEECPPTLTDLAVRDRRWAQGNLQHAKVVGASGLTWFSRLHMAIGIMSYLASPLWLVLLCVGFALSLQSHLIRPEYFTKDFQLFPTWPRFDAQLLTRLFIFSMFVLLIPKMFGLLRALVKGPIRRATHGIVGLLFSVILELVLSALYAPILMLTQSQHIFEILLGRDSGWNAQRRRAGDNAWSESWAAYRKHTLIGIVTGVIAYLLSPALLAWLSPALVGLLLAVPLSRASGSVSISRGLAYLGLMRTPEEVEVPKLVARRQALLDAAPAMPEDGLYHLARDREARLTHIHGNLARPHDPRGQPDPHALTAEQKLRDAGHLDEALQWLTPNERMHVAGSADMLNRLAALPELPRLPII